VANNLVKSFSPQEEEPVVVQTEAILPVVLETEEIVHISAPAQNEVLIRKKRRGVKGVPLEQPKNPVEKLLLPKKVESLDDIFLKTED